MAMDVAEIAAWEWDVASGRMTWSTEPEALFGFPPGSFGEDRRVFSAVHPDDRERVLESRRGRDARRFDLRDASTASFVPTAERLDHRTRTRAARGGRAGRQDRRREPGHQRTTTGGTGARAGAGQRTPGARRSGAPEPHQGRVPGDVEPRAADADERHSRLAEHAGQGRRRARSRAGDGGHPAQRAGPGQVDRRPARGQQADLWDRPPGDRAARRRRRDRRGSRVVASRPPTPRAFACPCRATTCCRASTRTAGACSRSSGTCCTTP